MEIYKDEGWKVKYHNLFSAVRVLNHSLWEEEKSYMMFNIYHLLAQAKLVGDIPQDFPAHDIIMSFSEEKTETAIKFCHLRMEKGTLRYKITSTALKLIDWAQEDGKFVADVVTLEEGVKIDTLYQDEDGYYLHSKREFTMFDEKEDNFIQIHGIIPTDWKENK
tara:strand:+ start:213 stop:704 length:492 start_codon:yes stop_codon:yes gene_type:complete